MTDLRATKKRKWSTEEADSNGTEDPDIEATRYPYPYVFTNYVYFYVNPENHDNHIKKLYNVTDP